MLEAKFGRSAMGTVRLYGQALLPVLTILWRHFNSQGSLWGLTSSAIPTISKDQLVMKAIFTARNNVSYINCLLNLFLSRCNEETICGLQWLAVGLHTSLFPHAHWPAGLAHDMPYTCAHTYGYQLTDHSQAWERDHALPECFQGLDYTHRSIFPCPCRSAKVKAWKTNDQVSRKWSG